MATNRSAKIRELQRAFESRLKEAKTMRGLLDLERSLIEAAAIGSDRSRAPGRAKTIRRQAGATAVFGVSAPVKAERSTLPGPKSDPEQDQPNEWLVRLRAAGNARFEQMLAAGGGVCTVAELAQRLGCDQDAVLVAVKNRELLAYRNNGQILLPVFQFDNDRPVAGLAELVHLLRDDLSDRAVILFFLTPIGSPTSAKTPVERLRTGDPVLIEQARLEARHYLEQLAT